MIIMADWILNSRSTKPLEQIPYQSDFAPIKTSIDSYPNASWKIGGASSQPVNGNDYLKTYPYKYIYQPINEINEYPQSMWIVSADEDLPYKNAFADLKKRFADAPNMAWVIKEGDNVPTKMLYRALQEPIMEERPKPIVDSSVPFSLPKDLLTGGFKRPRVFLCETDKTRIGQLEVFNFKGAFKFNSMSEISFEIGRTYNDFLTGDLKVNPYYDKVEALRLLEVEGFGFFEIQGPKLSSDGIKEIKEVTANSYEYILSQKYLTNFKVNTGEVDSIEVMYAENDEIVPVTLFNETNHKLSLLHLILEKIYGWDIGYVDPQLRTLGRTFSIDRMSIYDFIMNEICDKFNCLIRFDTVNSEINVYAEAQTEKFIGDGATNQFVISPPFYKIGTVSIDGYKTTQWEYDDVSGTITLDEAPDDGAHIEIVDDSLSKWETDVFVAFENLADKMDISYNADDIKTVLTVTYGEDNDIRETNLGLPYITDISYYYNVDWMGEELYDKYTRYLQKTNSNKLDYTDNSKKMQEYAGRIDFEENRLSLGYAISQVTDTTVGTYYIKGGSDANPYYTEVSLPADYNANTTYYKIDTANLAEKKVENLYNMMRYYFMSESHSELEDGTGLDWRKSAEDLEKDFAFMSDKYENLINTFKSVGKDYSSSGKAGTTRIHDVVIQETVLNFLFDMWKEIGRTPLKSLYYETYKQVQATNISAGWSEEENDNYPLYYPVILMLVSIENAIADRTSSIEADERLYVVYRTRNEIITESLLLENNFTNKELVRLNAFLREDELKVEDIIETEHDTLNESYKNKQHAMESGRITLSKLSQPKLSFSMTMANIYAIPEFESLVGQFQLGNLIKVKLRSDYVKQSRLLAVNINFDNMSDFSCDFGDLTSLRTQSDIHADLLANAINAGKQVATNASYWTKGTDTVTALELGLQNGLLDTVNALKSSDPNQNVSIDKYGIHLESIPDKNGNVSPKKVWMVNDKIVFTDDDFKTSKSIIGEYTINNETRWGLIAECVNAGIVEGCQMIGGTIKIGEYINDKGEKKYNFAVDENGTVTMSGGGIVDGFVTEDVLNNTKDELQGQIDSINNKSVYRIEVTVDGPTIISSVNDRTTMYCKVYSWDTDITDTLSASLFKWKRTSGNSERDIQWNGMPEHQGVKFITVNANDVIGNSNFVCEVDLP